MRSGDAEERRGGRGAARAEGGLELFAVAAPGLEGVLWDELSELGLDGDAEPGGVTFTASHEGLYRANLHLRTATRVLVRIARFRARSFIELERHARRVDWAPFVGEGATVAVRATSRKSKLYHERGIEERIGRWIREATSASDGDRPAGRAKGEAGNRPAGRAKGEVGDWPAGRTEDEDEAGAAQLVIVRIVRDECVISIDSSGALLHRRGYRQAVAKAPLRETLAAAMLRAAGWRGDRPLLDPMCGSGTIPIEAALIARRIPPGLAAPDRTPRPFAFEAWPSFDREGWQRIVALALAEIRDRSPVEIVGSDRDEGAIAAARANASRAGVADDIRFEVAPLSATPAPSTPGVLLTNPPYGVRVGETGALRDLYAAIGKLARGRLAGWEIALLAAEDGLVRQTGLEVEELLATRNGGIDVRMQRLATAIHRQDAKGAGNFSGTTKGTKNPG